MTEKTKGIAYGLLGRLEEKQTKLIHQEISLLEADSDLFSKIEKFKNLLFFLSPEEKRIHLESIKILCRSLYEKIEPDLIKTAQREIDFLEFREAFPIIEDLFGQDPSSFASQMQSIAYKIEKTNVLDSLKFLNNAQKKAIYSGRRNG
jgi:hypothetical protein